MSKVKMPVRYIGDRDEFRDHLYGSKLIWQQGEAVEVDVEIAIKLLVHPEFEDARDPEDQLEATPKELLGGLPPKPTVEKTEEEQREELDMEPPLVNLEGLTKAQLVEYAHRNFGVTLDPAVKKDELIDTVRRSMGKRVA